MRAENIIRGCMIALVAITLSACGETNDDKCEGPVAVSGEADMTAAPMLSAAAGVGLSTVTVSVAVDADTLFGGIAIVETGVTTVDSGNLTAFPAFTPGTAQTIDVSVDLPNPVAIADHYPLVVLCSAGTDIASCNPAVGYVNDPTNIISAGNYVRGTYDTATGETTSVANSCISRPLISVTPAI